MVTVIEKCLSDNAPKSNHSLFTDSDRTIIQFTLKVYHQQKITMRMMKLIYITNLDIQGTHFCVTVYDTFTSS